MHLKKGDQSIRSLNNWFRDNPKASRHDKLVARSLLVDLQQAMAGN
jgi:hypothetical protein